MKYFLYILLIFSFCYGCSSKKKERRIKLDEVIDYREVLFEGNDTLVNLSLDKKQNLIESMKSKKYWFDESYGREYKWFNLGLKSRKLKVGAYKYKPFPGVCPRGVIEVIVNRKNMLLFEKDLIESKGLDSLLFFKLKQSSFKRSEYLFFQWDENSDLRVIDSVFGYIERGYLLFYDFLAKSRYNKSIHNLDIKELKIIKEKYPFKVVILEKRRLNLFKESNKL